MHEEAAALAQLTVSPIEHIRHLKFPAAKTLRIYDSTLRDGEQMPGIAFSPHQKLIIARELSELGCHILDVGFPAVSAGERKALELILLARRQGTIRPDLEILVMCRTLTEEIDRTIDCIREMGFGPNDVTFLLFTSASGLHCKYKLGPLLLRIERASTADIRDVPVDYFYEANCRLVESAIRYARARGVTSIEFGAEDASRTPIGKLVDLVKTAAAAGAKRYVFADTTGCLTPEATEFYCSALARALPGMELASHFHNDFDLATVNVITAIRHGFTTFATTVNGIGERAGNAPLHSVVVALRFLYQMQIPGFRYERLPTIRRVVEEFSGIPVSALEPVIGHNAFAHESGIHARGVRIHRSIYEAIPYEAVGGVPRKVFGKHSGVGGILEVLHAHQEQISAPITRELAEDILAEIKLIREERSECGANRIWIEQYYAHLEGLGLTEEEVLGHAIRVLSRREATIKSQRQSRL
jgi:isopropylmalate/homocitrate/citramalate synthase